MPVENANVTVEQIALLRVFWWHMCQRIKREKDVQYCCGAQTATLALAVDIGKQLNPEIDDFRSYLLEDF